MDVKTAKKLLREEIWGKMEKNGIAKFPLPCYGRIPNFVGSEKTAERIRLLKEWINAEVVFANPDYAQQKVREHTLIDDKILVMASPRLTHGYVMINPKDVKGLESFASTIKGAFKYGRLITIQDMPKPDLIIEGSVAVDMHGHRLGKGHGYGDLEIGSIRRRFGEIPIATTVHDMQIVENVPSEEKDEKVSIIITPTKIIRV